MASQSVFNTFDYLVYYSYFIVLNIFNELELSISIQGKLIKENIDLEHLVVAII